MEEKVELGFSSLNVVCFQIRFLFLLSLTRNGRPNNRKLIIDMAHLIFELERISSGKIKKNNLQHYVNVSSSIIIVASGYQRDAPPHLTTPHKPGKTNSKKHAAEIIRDHGFL